MVWGVSKIKKFHFMFSSYLMLFANIFREPNLSGERGGGYIQLWGISNYGG